MGCRDAVVEGAASFAAEFLAMLLFVVTGCGSAMAVAGEPGWILQVSLTFGFAISALAYSIGHYSGGHINCAVTLGLVVAGHCRVLRALGNVVAQLLGSLAGACILWAMFPSGTDKTGGLGSNRVNDEFGLVSALVGEAVMTFLLVWVVLQTACNMKSATAGSAAQACMAIGFTVFLAHSVLIQIDGCSINPTRSFGPALMAKLRYGDHAPPLLDMWVFWAGPMAGASIAGALYRLTEGWHQTEYKSYE